MSTKEAAPPPHGGKMSSSTAAVAFSWDDYLSEQRARAAADSAFWQRPEAAPNEFEVDELLECADPKSTGCICLAEVMFVEQYWLLIRLVGNDNTNDVWMPCDSTELNPVGTAARGGSMLMMPVGCTKSMTRYKEMLRNVLDERERYAAPEKFHPISNELRPRTNGFTVGDKLEVLDVRNFTGMLHPATVVSVPSHRGEITVRLDGYETCTLTLPHSSRHMFPCGWSRRSSVTLLPPPVAKAKSAGRAGAKRRSSAAATSPKPAAADATAPALPKVQYPTVQPNADYPVKDTEDSKKARMWDSGESANSAVGGAAASPSTGASSAPGAVRRKDGQPASAAHVVAKAAAAVAGGSGEQDRGRAKQQCGKKAKQPPHTVELGPPRLPVPGLKARKTIQLPQSHGHGHGAKAEGGSGSGTSKSPRHSATPPAAIAHTDNKGAPASGGQAAGAASALPPPAAAGVDGVARSAAPCAKAAPAATNERQCAVVSSNAATEAASQSAEIILYVNTLCQCGGALDASALRALVASVGRRQHAHATLLRPDSATVQLGPAGVAHVLRELAQTLVDCSQSPASAFAALDVAYQSCGAPNSYHSVTSARVHRVGKVPCLQRPADAMHYCARLLEQLQTCKNLVAATPVRHHCRYCNGGKDAVAAQHGTGTATPPLAAATTHAASGGASQHRAVGSVRDVIRSWSVDEVVQRVAAEVGHDEADKFRTHAIDGAALLLLNVETMMKYMGMVMGPALKVAEFVRQIKHSERPI